MDRTRTTPDLVVVGSANADLVVHVEQRPAAGETVLGSDLTVHPGGKGANQAAAAARLGARVVLLGRVGADAYGKLLRDAQQEAGVNTDHLLTDKNTPTGTAMIVVGADGDNSIVVSPGANAALSAADIRAEATLLSAAPVVSLQLEIPMDTVLKTVRTVGPETRVVLNPSPPVKLPRELLQACDPLVVNEHEARVLLGALDGAPEDWAAALLKTGARSVVVTLGAQGAVTADENGSVRVTSPKVTAVDTTGAGDAFTGALAWRLSLGEDLTTAVGFAVRVGAAAVTRDGAQSSYPTLAELPA